MPPGFAPFDTGRLEDDDGAPAPAVAQKAAPDTDATVPGAAVDDGDVAENDSGAAAPEERPVSRVERPVSQGVAAGPAGALAALNVVPTADGGPRVIVHTAGFGDSGAATPSADTATGEPAGGNGHAADAGELVEIPAFLRRS